MTIGADHVIDCRRPKILSQTLIDAVKECFVLPDRSAKRASKVIALEARQTVSRRQIGIVEPVSRIQIVIPEIFKNVSVKLVCAALRYSLPGCPWSSHIRLRIRP